MTTETDCQKCGGKTIILETRKKPLGWTTTLHRRRHCLVCGERHWTAEVRTDIVSEVFAEE